MNKQRRSVAFSAMLFMKSCWPNVHLNHLQLLHCHVWSHSALYSNECTRDQYPFKGQMRTGTALVILIPDILWRYTKQYYYYYYYSYYYYYCSPCSPWWPFPYLVGVGLVRLLHSFRSRVTSWVTPTPAMSSFICWCHVFLGCPRRLVPGIASSTTLRVTLVASRLWTCPNQRRLPLRITSSIGERCNMRRISSSRIWSRLDTPRIPRSILISVVAIFLLLVTFIAQHSLSYVRAGLIMISYIFALSLRGIFRS